jgi:hypothetical protein
MKVISDTWFGKVGIVVTDSPEFEIRDAFIGIGQGNDEKADIEKIVAWGNHLPLVYLKELVAQLEKK